ncbi:hypothetical protein [Thalassospira marina]|uniref:Uncharacterized protein n=1 Tax=Thalassospira marina TaxID=2048283 RepID=A0A2N3KIR5_9PROT|nr:hypothetical protein [Thalassospira marina]PKR50449.1 hypothetical protein COO20_21490 [Thalassospira marina]
MLPDLKLISDISCYVLEPVPNDRVCKTVVGDGAFYPCKNIHAQFLGLLSGEPFNWVRANLGISYSVAYGRHVIQGWQLEMTIADFLAGIAVDGAADCELIKDWLAKLETFNPAWSVQCYARQEQWSLIDHLRGDYQARTGRWVETCFGIEGCDDVAGRATRFLEDALALYQAAGGTLDDATKLIGHVSCKPVSDPEQETGSVILSLAALSNARNINMLHAGEKELDRVWHMFPRIRAKHAKAAMARSPERTRRPQ